MATYHITEEFIKNCEDPQIINTLYCLQYECEEAPAVDYENEQGEEQVVYKFYLWKDEPTKFKIYIWSSTGKPKKIIIHIYLLIFFILVNIYKYVFNATADYR